MIHRRLNHTGNGIIDIMNGYQSVYGFSYFQKHGEGTFDIDLTSGTTKFNGAIVEQGWLFEIIHKWFLDDMKRFNLDVNNFIAARIIMSVKQISFSSTFQPQTLIQRLLNQAPRLISTSTGYRGEILVQLVTKDRDYSRTGICILNG